MITCPSCSSDTKILETRTVKDGDRIYDRRRRECIRCKRRVTTCESIVDDGMSSNIMVVKTATMELLLRTIAATFAPGTGGRAAEMVEALLSGVPE